MNRAIQDKTSHSYADEIGPLAVECVWLAANCSRPADKDKFGDCESDLFAKYPVLSDPLVKERCVRSVRGRRRRSKTILSRAKYLWCHFPINCHDGGCGEMQKYVGVFREMLDNDRNCFHGLFA